LRTLVAGAKLETGRAADALDFLNELQQLFIEACRADALRELDPRSSRVEEGYRIALRVAREQGALALELRAAMALWLAGSPRQTSKQRKPFSTG
jgi:hypothetical protein